MSLKVSTQYGYKTHATLSGRPVRSPHDYQAIDISDLYTTRGSDYRRNVEAILTRRLLKADIAVSPKAFFPVDETQEKEIRAIGEGLKAA